jgi:hypothetical protein
MGLRECPRGSQRGHVMKIPFALPSHLPADLTRVHAYWAGLLRGSATMPFWDDATLSDLPDLADRLLLVDVFDRPERFRFNTVGKRLTDKAVEGEFLDEVSLYGPLAFLRSQCSATVEAAAPTWFRQEPDDPSVSTRSYARLLLPMWGDGRIGMLLGAVDPADPKA